MSTEKRLIDGNGRYTLHASDNTDYSFLFRNGTICVENELGHCVCEFHTDDAPTVDAVEVPPIKIGDTAYFIINSKIYKADVYLIRWEHHKRYGIHSEISANVGPYSSVGASFDDFGKTVFLTEEAAKEALAKMDGERRQGE